MDSQVNSFNSIAKSMYSPIKYSYKNYRCCSRLVSILEVLKTE